MLHRNGTQIGIFLQTKRSQNALEKWHPNKPLFSDKNHHKMLNTNDTQIDKLFSDKNITKCLTQMAPKIGTSFRQKHHKLLLNIIKMATQKMYFF
jgi:hypothetical protein